MIVRELTSNTHAEHAVMPTDIHDPAQDAPVLDHAMQLASD